MRLFYTLRTIQLLASPLGRLVALLFSWMMVGTAVILKTFLDASSALTDALYTRLTNGIPENNGLYVICRIIAFAWIAFVWIILSHITVWLFHSVF